MHRPMQRGVRGISLVVVAAAGLTLTAPPASADMTFQAVQIGGQGEVISATGQITNSTPDRFAEFLDENPSLRAQQPVVLLDSPGGRVIASTEFGRLLRRVGASVIVARVGVDRAGDTIVADAECLSACVYAFMGASRRIVRHSSLIGIHRMFAYEAEMDANGDAAVIHRRYDDGTMREFLMRYSSEMGVSPGLIAAAEHISSDRLKILSRSEIRRWHLGITR